MVLDAVRAMVQTLQNLFEAITLGSLLGWTACLFLGCRLLRPDHAVAVGLAGLWIGWEGFIKLRLPWGPTFYGYTLLPGFCGSLLVVAAILVARGLLERLRVEGDPTLSSPHSPPRRISRG